MALEQIDLIDFIDVGSADEAFALVKAGDGIVGLTISLKEDGDIEVYLLVRHCESLITALQKAVEVAKMRRVG